MKHKRFYQFIGVAGFIFIICRIDVGQIWEVIKRAQVDLLIVVALLSGVVQVVKSLRWKALLGMNGIRCSFLSILQIYFIGSFLGALTPARVGDLTRVYFIKRNHAPDRPLGQIFANVIVDRFFDLALVAGAVLIGIPVLFKIWFLEMALISLLLIAAGSVMYYFRHRIIAGIKILLKPAGGGPPQGISWTAHLEEAVNGLRMLRNKKVALPVLYNIAAYGIFFFALRLMAVSLNMTIAFWYLVVSMSAAMILTLLPISLAGLGTREAVLIFFFSYSGIRSETTIGFSILYLFFFLILPGLLGAVPYFLLSPAYKAMVAEKTAGDA